MTDAEFDAIATGAFPISTLPSDRVWSEATATSKWDWIPTTGESLVAACLAAVVMTGFAYNQASSVADRPKVRVTHPAPLDPFEAGFLAVSRIAGLDLNDSVAPVSQHKTESN